MFRGDFLGQSGKFRIEYIVPLSRLQSDLNRAQELLRAHGANIGASMGGGARGRDPFAAMFTSSRRLNRSLQGLSRGQANFLGGMQRSRQAAIATGKALDTAGSSAKSAAGDLRTMGLALRRMLLWWSSAAIILGAQRLIKNTLAIAGAFQFVVRELQVLGDDGEAAFTQLAQAGFDAAASTGRSFSEAADAMKAWVRQGFAANDVANLTRTTLIGLNLTNLSSTELIRTLTAQMRAFNIPAERSISIIDTLVGVSRRYAIEAGQLATGLRRFAASSVEAGVSLEQQTGLMVAMMQRTQQSAQMVGRAGRTITTRLRRNAVEALETIAEINSFTDESRTSFRSLWDVLTDLSNVWDTLNQVEREGLAFQAAGLRQREFFLALMKDFNLAQEANIVALASGGIAMKSNTILVNSYQKSVAQLRVEWEKLLASQTGILSFFQSLIDGLRTLINVSLRVPAAVAPIGVAIATVGGVLLALGTFGVAHPIIGGIIAVAGALTLLTAAIGKFARTSLTELIENNRQLLEVSIAEAESIEKVAKEYIKLASQLDGVEKNTSTLVVAREKLNELSPSLLDGETDLDVIYDILTGRIEGLTSATDTLKLSRDRLIRSELVLAEAQAGRSISILAPGAEALAIEEGVIDVSNIENAKILVGILRDDYTAAIEHANLVTAAFASKGKTGLKEYDDLWREHVKTINENIEALERLPAPTSVVAAQSLLAIKLLRQERDTGENLIRQATADIDVARERRDVARDYASALKTQIEARKALLALDMQGPPVPPATIAVIGAEISPAALRRQLDFIEQNALLAAAEEELRTGQKTTRLELVDLDREIFTLKVAHLNLINQETNNENTRKNVLTEIDKLERGGLAVLEQKIKELKALSAEERERLKQQQAADEASLQHEAALFAIRNRGEAQLRERDTRRRATRIADAQGAVAAAEFVLAERSRLLVEAEGATFITPPSGTPAERARELQTLRAVMAAEEAVGRARDDLDRKRRTANEAFIEDRLERERIALEQGLRLTTINRGALAAQRESVQVAKDEVIQARSMVESENQRLVLKRRINELWVEENKLAAMEAEIVQDVNDVVAERADILQANEARLVGIRDGEEAALKFTLQAEREKLEAMLDSSDAADKAVEIEEQRSKVVGIRGQLEVLQLSERLALEAKVAEIIAKTADRQQQHTFDVIAANEGELAALNAKIAFLDTEVAREQTLVALGGTQLRLAELVDAATAARLARELLILNAQKESNQVLQTIIAAAGQLAAGAIGGDLTGAGFVNIIGGAAGSLAGAGPIGAAIGAATGIIAAIFEASTEDLEESLDTNTLALRRNTATLEDVLERSIGVASVFSLPAQIERLGRIPSLNGGGNVVGTGVALVHAGETVSQGRNIGSLNFYISGGNSQDIADEVMKQIDRQYNVDSRRGYVTPLRGR